MRANRRGGATVLWTLAVLAVLAVTSAVAAKQFLAARQTAQRRQNWVQCRWLARAGAELAAAKLLEDGDAYKGETVVVVPDSEVTVAVTAEAGKPDVYRVRCVARYPLDGPGAVSQALEWTATKRGEPAGLRLELVEP